MMRVFAANIIQFLDLVPAAIFCFLPMKNQLKYSTRKTVAICSGGILFMVFLAAVLETVLGWNVNLIYFPAMAVCFFCYDRLVKCGLGEELAVFFMSIALLSFMSDFAVAVDIKVHPEESIESTCLMSTFVQFIFSCVAVMALAHAMSQYGGRLVDRMHHTKIWYAMLPAPAIFLVINFVIQPLDYGNMTVGRIFFLYLFVLGILFVLMLLFYVMFYFVAIEIIQSGEQRERMRILEMQEHQYAAQQTYIEESARQRHDFRQSVITIAELVERNDLSTLKSYLQSFVTALPKNEVTTWCRNSSVNALLNYYEALLKQNGVKLRWEVSLQDCKVSDNDLCGMLGNLLENVYHACLHVETGERFHTLSVLLKNERDLYIVSSNSFDGETARKKDGKYVSSRRGGSGIGLSSIEITAEKYNGIARFFHEDKIFYIDVVMEV